jgi:hypothetical protein
MEDVKGRSSFCPLKARWSELTIGRLIGEKIATLAWGD